MTSDRIKKRKINRELFRIKDEQNMRLTCEEITIEKFYQFNLSFIKIFGLTNISSYSEVFTTIYNLLVGNRKIIVFDQSSI